MTTQEAPIAFQRQATVAAPAMAATAAPAVTPPLWLLAELTYRCPLQCVFCSNPLDYANIDQELSTQQWLRVFEEARALGAVQLGLSGGEPALRKDLETLVAHARKLGFYTNLITSGVGLNEARIAALKQAGLDHIQLSFQDSTQAMNDFLSHTRTFDRKKRIAAAIRGNGFPMVLNCVLHRFNLPHIGAIIDMALELGADYLELANTQYYGWAHLNRAQLMPTRAELQQAEAVVETYRRRIGTRCKILFVIPDYYEQRPKPCMNGWGRVFLGVAPDGTALPCHNARQLPGLDLPKVQEHSLRHIWYESSAFGAFRGDAWMQQPCRSCPERGDDFGGCRCQAYLVTGDASACDPVCGRSPQRHRIDAAISDQAIAAARLQADSSAKPIVIYRNDRNSRSLQA